MVLCHTVPDVLTFEYVEKSYLKCDHSNETILMKEIRQYFQQYFPQLNRVRFLVSRVNINKLYTCSTITSTGSLGKTAKYKSIKID